MARAFRFRLDQVMAIAEARRRQRAAELAAALAEQHAAERAAVALRLEAAERAAALAGGTPVELSCWAADRSALLQARQRAHAAAAAALAAHERCAVAETAYVAARQDRRVLERLRHRHGQRWAAAAAAEEQQRWDEAGALRASARERTVRHAAVREGAR